MMNGIIIINKEAGFTSFDVVAKLRGICGQRKIGHTGTLDPQATGVLPVCLGNAAKLCDMLTDKDKEYVAELLLGVTTDTQDTTGRVLSEKHVECDAGFAVRAETAIMEFVGEYDQIPPMYSAIKVNGRRLYELAREGKEVERKARRVTIGEIEILDMQPPVIRLRIVCSKGTYIRTLCADIGERIGCGGVMKSLVRTRVGRFKLEDALTLSQVQRLKEAGEFEASLIPVDSMFPECPLLHVQTAWKKLTDNGNAFLPIHTVEKKTFRDGEWVRVYSEDGSFVGIYAYDSERLWYKPVKLFM
ncbi:MAG: tRNA pseudouridine(55) synthase TruB [Lachnospiraceae bacterium]|nr:tRNA pseudouridine(55) synthase TruB [Lachnospiraceae bacterium]